MADSANEGNDIVLPLDDGAVSTALAFDLVNAKYRGFSRREYHCLSLDGTIVTCDFTSDVGYIQ